MVGPMRRDPRSRLWGRILMNAASVGSVGWGWLFYKHIWQAAIPAFGSPEPYLASLRWLLAKYLVAGGGLLLAWWAGFSLARSPRRSKVEEGTGQRQLGL